MCRRSGPARRSSILALVAARLTRCRLDVLFTLSECSIQPATVHLVASATSLGTISHMTDRRLIVRAVRAGDGVQVPWREAVMAVYAGKEPADSFTVVADLCDGVKS